MQHHKKGSFYDLLGVPPDATPSEIRQAFLGHAQRYHPDLNRDNPQAEYQFKQIRRVYEVLNDPLQRVAYDDYPARFSLDDVGVDWNNPATIVTEPSRSGGDPSIGDRETRAPRPNQSAMGVPWQHNLRTSRESHALLIGILSALLFLAIVVWQLPSSRRVTSSISPAERAGGSLTRSPHVDQAHAQPKIGPLRSFRDARQDEPGSDWTPAPTDARPAKRLSPHPLPDPFDGGSSPPPGRARTEVGPASYLPEPELTDWSVPETPGVASPSYLSRQSDLPALLPNELNAAPLPFVTPVPSESLWNPALQVRNWSGGPVGESPWSAPLGLPATRPLIGAAGLQWGSPTGFPDALPLPLPAVPVETLDAVSRENLLAGFRDAFNPTRLPQQTFGGGLLVSPFAPPTTTESPLGSPPGPAIPPTRFGMPPAVPPSTIWNLPSRPTMPSVPATRMPQPSYPSAHPATSHPRWP